MSVRRFKAKCRIRRAVLCIVFDGSPSKPAAECRFYDRKKMERWKALRLARSFFFLGEMMSDILEAARAFTKSHLRMPKQVRHDCWRLSVFPLRKCLLCRQPVRDWRGGEAVAIAMEPKGGTPESPTRASGEPPREE